MPTLMFAHAHLCSLNMWSIILVFSRKVDVVLLAASVSWLSPAMLNPSRNSDRNKTSTCYEPVIQFWRHSIANRGKSNIDKNTCELLKICSFLLAKLWMLFYNLHPSCNVCVIHWKCYDLTVCKFNEIVFFISSRADWIAKYCNGLLSYSYYCTCS